MKLGIVTIYDNGNLGNRLQNYALQHRLVFLGVNACTIKNVEYQRKRNRFKILIWLFEKSLINYLMRDRRRVKNLHFTKQFFTLSGKIYWYDRFCGELSKNDECNLYCAGSDQVWNPCFGRSGMFNYLGFAERDRTFSYAASFGIDHIPEEYVEDVRKGLQHIKYISVREDAGKRIVEELTGRTDVYVHVDPTMLLTAEEWDEVAACPKNGVPEKYILTYFLGDISEARSRAIQAKAQELGCEIIELMDQNGAYYETGPDEFVYLIKHAEMVCTDSFHGSVFSFLYERPFVVFDRQGAGDNMSSRLETLCGKFFLQDCMATGDVLPEISMTPDYSLGYTVLEEERTRSMEYFNMVFEEAERLRLWE